MKCKSNPCHHAITLAEFRHFCHHGAITCHHMPSQPADQLLRPARARNHVRLQVFPQGVEGLLNRFKSQPRALGRARERVEHN